MTPLYHVRLHFFGSSILLLILKKQCPTCTFFKEFDEFACATARKDGCTRYCKQCRSDRYYNTPPEKRKLQAEKQKLRVKAQPKQKRVLSPDQQKVANEKWNRKYLVIYSQDPEYMERKRATRNRYYQSHKLEAREYVLRRRARKMAAKVGRVSYKTILERDGYHCYLCDKDIDPKARKRSPESLTFDHVIPLDPLPGEPKGTHSTDNIRVAHFICNRRKSNKQLKDVTAWDRRGP